jgi:AAA+ superfamily predicted ATPase
MSELFDEEIELPDTRAKHRYDRLVGLETIKTSLSKNGTLLLDQNALAEWSTKHYGQVLRLVESVQRRTPLLVFAGDVGTGKTTLAETFGQEIAESRKLERLMVLRLSLRSRGSGQVGEMTRLLGDAFDEVIRRARSGKGKVPVVLVIDEADSIAQSRELAQMHHEDRAGVNALIRGIDAVAEERLPVIVVMCTNRLDALDPAVRRRAAVEYSFERPNLTQRTALLAAALEGTGISREDVEDLANAAGDQGLGYGHTYSDLTNRVLPEAVLSAFPNERLTADKLRQAIQTNAPTPPFRAA